MTPERFLIFGFLIIVIGMLVMMLAAFKAAERVKGGGVIVIGPFPIAFGSTENIAKIMMVVGIIIALMFIAFSLFVWRSFGI